MSIDYRGLRATILGLGHFGGGTAAARWLAHRGARVTVTDLANENALADSLPLLADAPIAELHLGSHREEDFQNADLVVVNPAVRPDSPWLALARRGRARLCTELELFMENCPTRIIGVTGSNGKSTTAAMIAAILCAAGRRTFLGGNIGGSLLDRLSEIGSEDWVVLEISSFQLWHFSAGAKMPTVAVVTGCTPNHLDWHGTFSDYAAAKQRILVGQTSSDAAVLSPFDAEVASWRPLVRGRLATEPRTPHTPCEVMRLEPHANEESMKIALPHAEHEEYELSVPGRHNRMNATCAASAASAAGCDMEAIRLGLQSFRGLPQRLERIATVEGRMFYNDSTATTPESTIAALESLDSPVWLLAGGKNKGFDFRPLAAEIAGRARGAAFFGTVRSELLARVAAADPDFCCAAVETMDEAFEWCRSRMRPGDSLVLSPGCASTDQFRNFRHRGERFAELVRRL